MEQLLAACGLSSYTPALTEFGVDSLEFLFALTDDELSEAAVGVGMKPLHVRKLLAQRAQLSLAIGGTSSASITPSPVAPQRSVQVPDGVANQGQQTRHVSFGCLLPSGGSLGLQKFSDGESDSVPPPSPTGSPMPPVGRAVGDVVAPPILSRAAQSLPVNAGSMPPQPLPCQHVRSAPSSGQAEDQPFNNSPMMWLPVSVMPAPGQALVMVPPERPSNDRLRSMPRDDEQGSDRFYTGSMSMDYAFQSEDEDSPDSPNSSTRFPQSASPAAGSASSAQDCRPIEPVGLSEGSTQHGKGCTPCAWFWKPLGCQHGDKCRFCHLCPEGEIKRRKKLRTDSLRKAFKEQRFQGSSPDSRRKRTSGGRSP